MLIFKIRHTKKNKMLFPNVIDLDCKIIPNKLLWHLVQHRRVLVRETKHGWHIISQDYRCIVCESFGDWRYAKIRDSGKPALLWHRKKGKKYSKWYIFRSLSIYERS